MEGDRGGAIENRRKEAKFYGAQNAVASNPVPENKPDPKVDGTQKNIVRAETVPKPKPFPLQPSAEPTPPKPPQEAQPKPKAEPIGDLAKAELKKPALGESLT